MSREDFPALNPPQRKAAVILAAMTLLIAVKSIASATVIHVTVSADSGNTLNGQTWDAPTNLQRAVRLAQPGDEIWVATGCYYPDEVEGQTNGDPNATFQLGSEVALRGGFIGTEQAVVERAFQSVSTVFSGDINQDDSNDDANGITARADDIVGNNSYHVVSALSVGDGALLDGITITAGLARTSQEDRGAGLYVAFSKVRIERCAFMGNSGSYGGGIFTVFSQVTAVSCTFSGNAADTGGGVNETDSESAFVSCVFEDNSGYGGGLHLFHSNSLIANSVITGNDGGGIVSLYSRPTVSHCTVTANRSTFGSAIVVDGSEPSVDSTIVWGNVSGVVSPAKSRAIYNSGGTPTFSNCIIQDSGGSSSWDARLGSDLGGNTDVDPLFVPGPLMTLQASSPVVNRASAFVIPDIVDVDNDGDLGEPLPLDIAGNSRSIGEGADIGAIELTGPRARPIEITIPAGGTPEPATVALRQVFDDSALTFVIEATSPTDFISASLDAHTAILTVAAAAEKIGTGSVLVSATTATGERSELLIPVGVFPDVVYVNQSAAREGNGNGLSWNSAFPDLNEALALGSSGYEIWVASGTYYPQTSSNDPRAATFAIPDGVVVRGGFCGDETSLHQRDFATTPYSVLSGDIDRNDLSEKENSATENVTNIAGANSYHVVTLSRSNSATKLDGFYIVAGDANLPSDENGRGIGGGILDLHSDATVANCRIVGNRSVELGAGAAILGSSSNYINCHFANNDTNGNGGGVGLSSDATVMIVNTVVTNNTARNYGGGLALSGSQPTLINCTVVECKARVGGAFAIFDPGQPHFHNTIIWSNGASRIYYDNSIISRNVRFSHCLVQGSGGSGDWNGSAGVDLGGNLDADPLLFSSSLIVQASSPVIDAGEDQLLGNDAGDIDDDRDIAEILPVDALFSSRITGAAVDLGAIEFSGPRADAAPALRFTPGTPAVQEALRLADLFDESAFTFAIVVTTGDDVFSADLDPVSGVVSLQFPQGNAARAGHGTILATATDGSGLSSGFITQISVIPDVLLVNSRARGTGSGLSWSNAMVSLQDALNLTQWVDGLEIWVASGIYYPDEGAGQTDGDREASFKINSSRLYGGFSGIEISLAERVVGANPPTVLSGDISQNDTVDGRGITPNADRIAGDNSYQVIVTTASAADAKSVMDGLVICGGGGRFGSSDQTMGGGTFSGAGEIQMTNCQILGNHGQRGGVLSFDKVRKGTLTNCIFAGNTSYFPSGIIAASAIELIIEGCTIADNNGSSITALIVGRGAKTIRNSIFWGNVPTRVHFLGDPPGVANCIVQNSGGSGGDWDSIGAIDNGGNLDVDPLLAPDTLGPSPLSPAIDSGVPNESTAQSDLAGRARIEDGDFDKIPVLDLGPYEYDPTISDTDRDGLSDGLEHALTGNVSEFLPPTIHMSIGSPEPGVMPRIILTYDVAKTVADRIGISLQQSANLGLTEPWGVISAAEQASKTELPNNMFRYEHHLPATEMNELQGKDRYFRLAIDLR